tara:strand:- start:17321 stop:18466 length:1146 start_codon:yes stop_codon:yes gene_type:complete
MTKSILFVTSTRADFGKLEPLASASRDNGYNVTFYVTGMHMLEKYGMTKFEVSRLRDIKIHEVVNQKVGDPLHQIISQTIIDFSIFLKEQNPDLVVIHGDRAEALACAIACSTNNIMSAHIEGGEISGTIDEVFRHCNTKFCNHHFVSSKLAAKRIMAFGEPSESIHVIGSPELDFHAQPSGVSIEEVREYYDIPFNSYGICIFHPVTSELDTIGKQAEQLFNALKISNKNFVIILPNNDPGSDKICSVIERLPKDNFRVLPSMRFSYFSELMKNAKCMVGNSSAGVREAPFIGISSLDIGSRQHLRSDSKSIHSAIASDEVSILGYLNNEWGQNYPSFFDFGEGNASQNFIQAVRKSSFWKISLQKKYDPSFLESWKNEI